VTDQSDAPGPSGEDRGPEAGRSGRQSRAARQSGSDLAGDFQRWLLRSSARSMGRELTGQVRRTFSGNRAEAGDVWATATAEPEESVEAPECAWCPICRTARRIRESGPGFSGQLAGAGDAVAAAVAEALSAFDSVLSVRPPGTGPNPEAGSAAGRERPDSGPDDRG
jgi:hypothetical protein